MLLSILRTQSKQEILPFVNQEKQEDFIITKCLVMDIDPGYNANKREPCGLSLNQQMAAIYDVHSAGAHPFRVKSNAPSMHNLRSTSTRSPSSSTRAPR